MSKFDKPSAAVFAVMSLLLVLVSWGLNKPVAVPAWPDALTGVSFSPFRASQSPDDIERFPSAEQVLEDLTLIDGEAKAIRTYSVEGVLGDIPELAKQTALDVTVGVWLGSDKTRNELELARLQQIAPTLGPRVTGIVVGNEVLLREELTAFELVNYLKRVRRIVGNKPITVAETWDIWLENPVLARHVDFVTAHVLPYWEGIPVSASPDYVFTRYEQLQEAFPDKPVLLGEVGWPGAGRRLGGAVPSGANQVVFMREFLQLAHERNIQYFALEAFDQPWKIQEGEVGRYWGIFNAQRQPKHAFDEPSIRPVNAWLPMLALTIAAAGALSLALLKDSHHLRRRGKAFLIAISFAIASFLVWHLHSFFSHYLVGPEMALAAALLLCVLTLAAALAVEAHEWAETLWKKQHRVAPLNTARLAPAQPIAGLPKVSIHVPIHNEPPELVIKTLQALKRLEYPDFEVLIVDNNTSDKNTWLPVERWCKDQGPAFRFFHVNPLDGFKAGALNYALEHTADEAEIIAVIDSDYVVRSDWLTDCVPLFTDTDVAIVQAPQDYRDAEDNLFKSMLYCEYAGFFGIGMINRDARNAIIQHGTMTLVRRTALENVDGWSQWCITEDAELGLKMLETGRKAIYIPTSYGQGLMPDTFHDYRMQRFRWAYGSMRILRKHARELLLPKPTRLSAGQRYHFLAGWFPWVADALCLLFNLFAIGFSTLLVLFPDRITPPVILLSALPLAFFGFKVCKMLMLYRYRLKAGVRQSIAAAIAGLAVSHTIARAMLCATVHNDVGFFRTPKQAEGHSLFEALGTVREESLMAAALLSSAGAVSLRDDNYLSDTRLWVAFLCVQSLPYLSSMLLSVISSAHNASAALVIAGNHEQAEKGQAFQTGLNVRSRVQANTLSRSPNRYTATALVNPTRPTEEVPP